MIGASTMFSCALLQGQAQIAAGSSHVNHAYNQDTSNSIVMAGTVAADTPHVQPLAHYM